MPALARKIRTFVMLTQADRNCAIISVALMTIVRIALWMLPFRWVKRIVQPCGPCQFGRHALTEHRITWAVRLASRYIPCATCLTQALTAQILFCWAGIEATLHIGVRSEQKFEAHAWVECGGVVAIGRTEDIERFTPLLTLTGTR